MAVESPGQRPIFAREENEYLIPTKPPISRLAIGSLILGLVSALAAFNATLIALPILAAAIGLAAYWQISRTGAVSGSGLALAGLALGLTFGIWGVTAARLSDRYLYEVSSQFAKHYLELIGEDRLLDAFELMQPETARQVAGTSLEEHYARLTEIEKAALTTFRNDKKTHEVVAHGTGTDWQLLRGVRVNHLNGGVKRIIVRMIDRSQSPPLEVDVTLARERNAGTGDSGSASWYVVELN